METILANAINGINAMPPRGTCNSCSDEEIQASIDYMLEN
jgi:cytochrome c5